METRGRPKGKKTLTQEEINHLRRVHKLKPEDVGPQHRGTKPGFKMPKPLPEWLDEWFKRAARINNY